MIEFVVLKLLLVGEKGGIGVKMPVLDCSIAVHRSMVVININLSLLLLALFQNSCAQINVTIVAGSG